jgi:hypothetical protein
MEEEVIPVAAPGLVPQAIDPAALLDHPLLMIESRTGDCRTQGVHDEQAPRESLCRCMPGNPSIKDETGRRPNRSAQCNSQ